MRRVNAAHDMGERRPFGRDTMALPHLRDPGNFMAQRLEQARHTVAPLCRADHHGHQMPQSQLSDHVLENLVARGLDIGDQFLHEPVVVVGEALEHGEARLLLAIGVGGGQLDHGGDRVFAIDIGTLQREIDEAGRDAILPNGDLPQQERRARGRLQHRERVADARARGIDLVEEQDAREPDVLDLAQDHLERRRLLRIGLADDDGRVANGKHIAHLVHELDGAGAIDESVAVAEEFRGGDVRLYAHSMCARLGAGIADARSFAHAALAGDGAGPREHGLEKRRLAALKGPHDRDEPRPGFLYGS